MDINVYIRYIKNLKTNKSPLGEAPHKPILLLAIMKLVGRGIIFSNRIAVTPDLVLEFQSSWKNLVLTKHKPNFSYPFFHMKSEPF
jgi:putative restriction endonuclease